MQTIDSLDIQIAASAQKANEAINGLITNLNRLSTALNVDTSKLSNIGKNFNFGGIDKAAKNMQSHMASTAKSTESQMRKISGSARAMSEQMSIDLEIAMRSVRALEQAGVTTSKAYRDAVSELKRLEESAGIKISVTGAENIKKTINEIKDRFDRLGMDFKFKGNFEQVKPEIQGAYTELDKLLSKEKEMISAGKVDTSDFEKLQESIARIGNKIPILEDLRDRTRTFNQSLKQLKVPPINEENLAKLQSALKRTEADTEKLKAKLSNAITMGRIVPNVDDSGFRKLTEQIALSEKQAEALRGKIWELGGDTGSTGNKMNSLKSSLSNVSSQSSKTSSSTSVLGKNIKNLSSAMSGFSSSANKAISGMKSFTRQVSSAMGVYLGIYGVIQGIRKSITIASDLTEVQNVVDVTFGDMAYKVEELAKTSIEQFGMSELSLKQYASRFQSMGTAMGISPDLIKSSNKFLNSQTNGYVGLSDSMSDVSLNLTKLTADMASLYNVDQKTVAKDLAAIFTGTTVPLRKYGLDLTQATLSEWAMKQGLDADIKSMSQAEKTMLRYQYVLSNMTAAQGDFARTSGTWANQTRVLIQQFEQLASVIGKGFVAAFKPFVKTLNTVMGKVIAFSETVLNSLGAIFGWKFEISAGGLTDDLGESAGYTDDLASGAGDASDGYKDAAKNAKKLKDVVLGIDELNINAPDDDTGSEGGSSAKPSGGGGGLGDLGAGEGGLTTNMFATDNMLKAYESSLDTLYKLGEYIGDTLTKAMNSIDWNKVYDTARNFGKGLADFLNGLISPDLFGAVGRTIAGALNTAVYAALSFGETFNWKEFGLSIATGINEFFNTFDFVSVAKTINVWVSGIFDTIFTAIDNVDWGLIGKKIGTFIAEIDILKAIGKFGKAVWKAVNAAIKTYAGTFSKAPFETALLSMVAAPKVLKGFTTLSNKIKALTGTSKLLIGAFAGNADSIATLSGKFPKLSKAIDVSRQAFANFRFGIENGNLFTGLNAGISTVRDNLTKMQKGAITAVAGIAEFSIVSSTVEGLALKTEDLGSGIAKIGGVVAAAGVAMYTALGTVGAAVAAATGLIAAIQGIEKASEQRAEFEAFGESVSTLTERIRYNTEAVYERLEASKEAVSTAGIAEAQMAQDLSNEYFALAEKQTRTNEETERMKGLADLLIQQFPQLEEKYNKETGLIDGTRESIQQLIDTRAKEAQAEAIQNALTQSYEAQNEAIKILNENAEKYNAAQEEIAKAEEHFREITEREGAGSKQAQMAKNDLEKLKEKYGDVTTSYEEAIGAFDSATDDIEYYMGSLNDTLEASAENTSSNYVDKLATGLSDDAQTIYNTTKQLGDDAKAGFGEGVAGNTILATLAAGKLVSDAMQAMADAQQSSSPSKVTMGLGKDAVDGYNKGIEENSSSTKTPIESMMKSVVDWMTAGLAPIKESIPRMMSSVWDGIKNIFTPVGKFFSDTFANAYNAIKTVFSTVNTWFDEKWKAVKSVFSPTVQFFSDTFINAYNAVKTAFSFINTWFQDKWNAVKNVFRDVRQFFKEKFEAGYNAVKAAFNAINTWFSDKWTAVKNVFKDVKTFFSDAFQSAYNAVKRIWDGIGGYFKGIANDIVGPIEKAVNGVIDGIKWILEKVGATNAASKFKHWEAPRFASGTNGLPRDTIGVVNDQKGSVYKELIVPPHGKPFIPEGRNVVLPMEKGTKIMPAKQTKAFMNGMPHFAGGIGDFLSGAWEAIKNFTGNVMDYLTKPSEILKIALDKFVNMSGWSGIYGDIASGAISKVFNNVSDYIKGIFDNIVPEVSYNASAGVEQWRQLATHALRITGQLSDSNVNALLMQMQHESGGNPNAINNWDINAKRGTPSKGLMQVIDPTFRTWALSPYDKNIYDPLSNMIAAIRYTVSRYGSLYNGWTARGYKGYATGIGAIRISDLIPKYQVGGFPEDGLFYANHNEVVGQFANGKTAVANNHQIEEGIEEASYRGFMRAMREMSPYLRDIADNTKKTAEKDMSVRIGDRDIVESYRRGSTRMGYAFSR